ncbi:MAG: ATP-dependent RNA helicase HrpA [Polyangiaceae bacterium]|nr:ATP-dependent RNA helicase HrpA [Polyangiaceae bacterium]
MKSSASSSGNNAISFPEELPISAHVRDIARAIFDHQVVIVAGETGSGKTTQLPKICLAMGRGLVGRIGVTQPRRIAATSVAARVATELGVELGNEVGYQIRFASKISRSTYVKFMTDGILLAETQGDPKLATYDTLIIDEAHERSLNIDFLLGYLKKLLPARPDLRVIVSSATLELDRFAAFFDGAPVISVSGRTFPVETIYRPRQKDEVDVAEAVANTVEEITEIDKREDILVFLPGEREIRETAAALHEHALPHTVVLPLYGRLSQAEQSRVFTRLSQRRIVLSTNVAETSLTIPGIVYVVDAGVARINRYQPRSGVTQLLVEPISRASADQRKGRAGRTRSGVCFRLYEERDFDARPPFTDPEVLRVGLAGAILQMKSLGLGDIRAFPFLDPPPKRAVDEGYRVLEELGAIDAEGALTSIGDKLARLPVDPRIGRMILGGQEEGALAEVLVIAAALGIQDPRERPLAAQKQADQAHRRFLDDRSDFVGLLKLWSFFRDETKNKSQGQIRKLCRDHYLSFLRMTEWSDVHQQLGAIARELGLRVNDKPAGVEAIHRAILPGLLSRIGMWHPESRTYIGARQTRFVIHPSSGLSKKPPQWIVVAELVETSQLFGRMAAAIDPAWLESIAGSLVRRSHGDPTFTERSAQVMAKEHVTLYGLPIVRDKKVHYGPIDPTASRRVFLVHALVRGEYAPEPAPPFLRHNRAMFAEVKRLRDRARRSDMIADDDAVSVFFEQRVPEGVYSGKTFEAWRAEAEAKDPRVLFLSLSDLLVGDDADLTPARYPDSLELAGAKLTLSYRFDPGEEDDGITVSIPVALLPQLDPNVLEWTIPAYVTEKISLLLFGLPKSVQRNIGNVKEVADLLASQLRPFACPLLSSVTEGVFQLTGARIGLDAFRLDELPPHLRLHFRVVDGGKTLGEGRDLAQLQTRFLARGREAFAALPKRGLEKESLAGFPAAGLPEHTTLEAAGTAVFGYPALVETDRGVDLRVVESRLAADDLTRAGLRRLFLAGAGTTLDALEKQVPPRIAASGLSDSGQPRKQIAWRAVDEAFELDDAGRFPRTAKAFDDRLAQGRGRLKSNIADLSRLGTDIAVELDQARAMLKSLAGKPGAPRAALDDVRTQLEYLVPPGMLARAPKQRLLRLPSYLRAIRVRLERLPNGPQKDQSKAQSVLPLWQKWLENHASLVARGVAAHEVDAFRWLVEELRVAVFAPEVGASVSVSKERLSEMWQHLADG